MKIVPASYEILDRRTMNVFQKIEQAGRLAYKSEDKITAESAEPFVNKLTDAGHYPVIEFANIHVLIEIDRSKVTDRMVDNEIEKLIEFLFPCKYLHLSASFNSIVLSGTVRAFMNLIVKTKDMDRNTLPHLVSATISNGYKDKFPYKVNVAECYMDGYTCSVVDAEIVRQRLRPDQIEEHLMCAVKFIHNRAFTHELVRHRIASFIQECLSGDTQVSSFSGPGGKEWTMSKLYEYSLDQRHGRFELIRLKGVLDDGRIVPVKIKSIKQTGVQKVFRVTTKNARSIVATNTHKFLTTTGWKELKEIKVGDSLIANGISAATNVEFIRQKYLVENMPRKEVAKLINMSDAWLGKQIRKLGLQKPKNKYPGRKAGYGKPGMFSDEMRHNISIRQTGANNSNYKHGDTNKFSIDGKICTCGSAAQEMHHVDRDRTNNDESNMEFLCVPCHNARHHEKVKITFPVEIISIEEMPVEMTYDLEIDHPCHNFVANGLVVHNSQRYVNYSLGKHGNEVTFIAPTAFFKECLNINDSEEEINIWIKAMQDAEFQYLRLLNKGASPQAARTVLPNSCKTEIIIFATIEEWRHIFSLRTSAAAEPSMREVMCPLAEEFFSEENQKLWE